MPLENLDLFRQRFPQYHDLSDQELAQSVLRKYPEYQDLFGDVATHGSPLPPTTLEAPPPKGWLEPGTMSRGLAVGTGGALGAAGGGLVGGPPGAILGSGVGAGAAEWLLGGSPEDVLGSSLTGIGSQAIGEGSIKALSPLAKFLGLSRELTPEAQATRQGFEKFKIPYRASDITGSRPVGTIESMPGRFAFGSGTVQKFAQGQIVAAEKAAEQVVRETRGPLDKLGFGVAAQHDAKRALQSFRVTSSRLFRDIESMTGDEPVVPTDKIREAAQSLIVGGRETRLGAPRQAASLRRIGIPEKQQLTPEMQADAFKQLGFEAAPRTVGDLPQTLLDQLIETGEIDPAISFRTARQLQSELGAKAFRGTAPIGSPEQGKLKMLYAAISQDLDTFLETADDVNDALNVAKQTYSTGKAMFNESIKRNLTSKAVSPEHVVSKVFRPGAITDTLDFRQVASDEVWAQGQAAWLTDMFNQALKLPAGTQAQQAGDQVFSPSVWSRQMQPYLKSGQLDVILGDKAAVIREFTDIMAKLGRAELMIGNPSGTGGALLSVGQVRALLTAILAGGGALAGGGPTSFGGAVGGAITALSPVALAKFTTSPAGVDFLMTGFSGNVARPAIRFAAQVLGQDVKPTMLELLGRAPSRPPAPRPPRPSLSDLLRSR